MPERATRLPDGEPAAGTTVIAGGAVEGIASEDVERVELEGATGAELAGTDEEEAGVGAGESAAEEVTDAEGMEAFGVVVVAETGATAAAAALGTMEGEAGGSLGRGLIKPCADTTLTDGGE
jgi:hypothetical protein